MFNIIIMKTIYIILKLVIINRKKNVEIKKKKN